MRAFPVTLLFAQLAFSAAVDIDLTSVFTKLVSDVEFNFPFNPGFDIENVAKLAQSLPTHSWEYGAAAQAILELFDPSLSVFSQNVFPVNIPDPQKVQALKYAAEKIIIGQGADGLSPGEGSVGDPASLIVYAIMLGKTDSKFADAAKAQLDYVRYGAPRWENGAISHRSDVSELWADFMYMVPPALAFAGADSNDGNLLRDSVTLCSNYRDVLQLKDIGDKPWNGVWQHIVGPQSSDPYPWSSGNGWAAAGMTRVLATVANAPEGLTQGWKEEAINNLTTWVKEIVDGARGAPLDNGLIRNYLDNTWNDGHGFGEISGSSLLTSVVYRMAVLRSDVFDAKYVAWADRIRKTIAGNDSTGAPHVTADGVVHPAVDPLAWTSTAPWTTGSPEGQAFVVLLYSAWRDCIYAGNCQADSDTPQFTVSVGKRHAHGRHH